MVNCKFLFIATLIFLFALTTFAQDKTLGGAKGKVRDRKGDSIAGVLVEARQNGVTIAEAKTAKDGNFTLTKLNPGTYDFLISKDGYAAGSLAKVEIKAGDVRNLGSNLVLATDEGSIAIIKGVIFDQDGRSVSGAEVKIAKISGDSVGKSIATYYSSISGDFTFKLPANSGEYRIFVKVKGAEPATKDVAIQGAQVYRMAISLKPVN